MLAKYFSIIRNYVLSVSLQITYNFYNQNKFLDALRTNSRNIIGRNPSMVIPLLANRDLTPMFPNPLLSGEYEVNKSKVVFIFNTIELIGIRDAFVKIKTAKSFGIDNISSYFMKLALPSIDNSLAVLFNTSIETSQFPNSWKVARVAPIFKEVDKTEKSNYRPISVLPVISKLFENLSLNSYMSLWKKMVISLLNNRASYANAPH